MNVQMISVLLVAQINIYLTKKLSIAKNNVKIKKKNLF